MVVSYEFPFRGSRRVANGRSDNELGHESSANEAGTNAGLKTVFARRVERAQARDARGRVAAGAGFRALQYGRGALERVAALRMQMPAPRLLGPLVLDSLQAGQFGKFHGFILLHCTFGEAGCVRRPMP